MSQILPRLWIAPADTVRDPEFLRECNITHVLNCAAEEPARYPQTHPVTVEHVPLTDDDDPVAHIQIVFGSLHLATWMRNPRANVVVHCKAGISRSVTLVLAWMILYDNHTFESAYEAVQSKRMFILPNSHYMKILRGMDERKQQSKEGTC